MGLVLAAAYLGSIVATNWAVAAFGIVPVGFGLMAPAAVYVVGLTLVLRDSVQHRIGKTATFALIAMGAALSALFSPSLALASGVAFLVSESADFATYTLAQRFGHIRAALASNVVSIPIDSLVFLALAFGSQQYLAGQIAGKVWATLAAVAVLTALRARRAVTA